MKKLSRQLPLLGKWSINRPTVGLRIPFLHGSGRSITYRSCESLLMKWLY